jgi:hypothetical protein
MKTVKTFIFIITIFLFYSSVIFAQNIKPENVVDISSKSAIDKTKEGKEVTLNIILSIKDTWHINANKPLDESLTPTVVKFDQSKDYVVQSIIYPPAEMVKLSFSNNDLAVYEMQATIRTKLFVGKTYKGGKLTVEGTLQYQPCNDQTCLFPISKPFSLEIKLK